VIDIHCHALPEVDDGAASMDVAIEMLSRAAAEGITSAILTPHIAPGAGPDRAQLHEERFAELKVSAGEAAVGVELYLGAEVAFRFGLAQVAAWPSARLAGGSFVLVDLAPGPLSPGLEQGFFELRTAGCRPILAHPERHRELVRSPQTIQRLREQDLLLQIDAGSLMGQFGRRARAAAEMLVERRWAEFVASDGHGLRQRPMSLAPARDRVAELAGPEEAERLFRENPGRVIRGQAPTCGEPATNREPGSGRERRWWHRLGRGSERKEQGPGVTWSTGDGN